MRHDRKDLDKTLRQHLLLFEKHAVNEADSSRERIWERLKRRIPSSLSPVSDDALRNTRRFSRQLTPARIAACFIAVVLASAVFYRAVMSPDELYAIVETTDGSAVQISQGRALAANVGDKIGVDTLVRTGSGEAKLRLPDGSRIQMQPSSELSWQRAEDGLHIQLKQGSVNVTPAEEAVGKLYVQNREQLVPVLGAVFQSAAAPIQPASTPIQSPATPKWDVVSIRPCENAGGGGRDGGPALNGPPIQFSTDRMNLRCQTTRGLVELAYVGGAASYEVHTISIEGGPAWIDSELYTIEAKAEKPVARDEMRDPITQSIPMLQTILEERFSLKIRREAREVPVFALTVAKGGLKMKPHQEGSCTPRPDGGRTMATVLMGAGPTGTVYCGFSGGGPSRGGQGPAARFQTLEARGLAIEQFIKQSPLIAVGKPVLDKTGLTGKFDFRIDFAFGAGYRAGRPEGDFDTGPTFIEAMQDQLGLKLENTKGPWEHFVIDHVERPTPN